VCHCHVFRTKNQPNLPQILESDTKTSKLIQCVSWSGAFRSAKTERQRSDLRLILGSTWDWRLLWCLGWVEPWNLGGTLIERSADDHYMMSQRWVAMDLQNRSLRLSWLNHQFFSNQFPRLIILTQLPCIWLMILWHFVQVDGSQPLWRSLTAEWKDIGILCSCAVAGNPATCLLVDELG
jgi:hypothetical protein